MTIAIRVLQIGSVNTPNSEETLRDPVIYDEIGDWNQDTRWSLRNQIDLETWQSQQSGAVNVRGHLVALLECCCACTRLRAERKTTRIS